MEVARQLQQAWKAGYSMRAIGKLVGLSSGGVHAALERVEQGRPGRDPRALTTPTAGWWRCARKGSAIARSPASYR